MIETEATQRRKESQKRDTAIQEQWKNFRTVTGRDAYTDLMTYIQAQHDMLVGYSKERMMPHPRKEGEYVNLDNDTIATLLQTCRGLDIVKTYIQSLSSDDVAQPTSK